MAKAPVGRHGMGIDPRGGRRRSSDDHENGDHQLMVTKVMTMEMMIANVMTTGAMAMKW